jgi:hypothetical protein
MALNRTRCAYSIHLQRSVRGRAVLRRGAAWVGNFRDRDNWSLLEGNIHFKKTLFGRQVCYVLKERL